MGYFSCLTCAKCVLRTSHPLLDREHRVVGVLLGTPSMPKEWQAIHDEAWAALQSVRSQLQLPNEGIESKRGAFPSLAHGLSYGGGQLVRASLCLLSYSNV